MRKIKLMALLLATLMIVSAFAGCAGVKKDEFDALDVRVQALEALLNGQQKDLEEIKNSVDKSGDNTEILNAIESVKTDLEDKIKDVNDRIDKEIGKADTTTQGVSAETKAAQQKALARIEVMRAEYSKNSIEYTTDEYKKISEALGTATGAVNAATTVEAVNAAMSALDAELGKYMTYAMKAYDYYVQLLGGVNADAEALVEAAEAFLKEVKAVYGDDKVEFTGKLDAKSTSEVEKYIAELAYLAKEGNTDARDQYIDVYTAIDNLCDLYNKKGSSWDIPYVDEDGDVDTMNLESLYYYTNEAELLVDEIKDVVGANLVYGKAAFNAFPTVYTRYETYIEEAALLGGDKLVALVTNAADVVAANDTYKLINEAIAVFDTFVKDGTTYNNVFHYYNKLKDANANRLIEYTYMDGNKEKTVWVADEYAKVESDLQAWKTKYSLSDKNFDAIIVYKITQKTYDEYKLHKHENDLNTKAVDSFKTKIVPQILALNELREGTVEAVKAFSDLQVEFKNWFTLQKENTSKKAPYRDTMKVRIQNYPVILREAGLFDDYAEERIAYSLLLDDGTAVPSNEKFRDNSLIKICTFAGDVKELEDNYFDAEFDSTGALKVNKDEFVNGTIYNYIKNEYTTIKTIFDAINVEIDALVAKADVLTTNEGFIKLEGNYKKLEGTQTGPEKKSGVYFAESDNVYVALKDVKWNVTDVAESNAFKAYLESLNKIDNGTVSNLSIKAFLDEYELFANNLKLNEFNEAKAKVEARLNKSFELADKFLAELEAVKYVRTDYAKYYKDKDNDKKKDSGEDTDVNQTYAYQVSLNDKADVEKAYATFIDWNNGGNYLQENFMNAVNDKGEKYSDVFTMTKVNADNRIADARNTIVDLVADIDALEALADKFIAAAELIKSVDAKNKFEYTQINATDSTLANLAYTSFVASTATTAKDFDGVYSVVILDSKGVPYTKNVKVEGADVEADAMTEIAKVAPLTKTDLLKVATTAYKAFVEANIEFVAASANKYTDTKDDWFDVKGYDAYKPFDDAVAANAQYELLAVKGVFVDKLSALDTSLATTLTDAVKFSTSIAAIENNCIAYYSEELKTTIEDALAEVANFTAYDFATLHAFMDENTATQP